MHIEVKPFCFSTERLVQLATCQAFHCPWALSVEDVTLWQDCFTEAWNWHHSSAISPKREWEQNKTPIQLWADDKYFKLTVKVAILCCCWHDYLASPKKLINVLQNNFCVYFKRLLRQFLRIEICMNNIGSVLWDLKFVFRVLEVGTINILWSHNTW